MSVLQLLCIREMGGSPLIIGIIIATEAFGQFCAAPLIGHLSDRVGLKRILIVTLAIAAISFIIANAQCILFILLARTLFGISAGSCQPPRPTSLPIVRTSKSASGNPVSSQAALVWAVLSGRAFPGGYRVSV